MANTMDKILFFIRRMTKSMLSYMEPKKADSLERMRNITSERSTQTVLVNSILL